MQHEQFYKEYIKRNNEDKQLRNNKYSLFAMVSPLNIELSTVDINLKYTSISNPHHNPDKNHYLGKSDEQIYQNKGSKILQALKQHVIQSGKDDKDVIELSNLNDMSLYSVSVSPLLDENGQITGATCASADITDYSKAMFKKIKIINLQNELLRVKMTQGILPVCSYCKSIKDEEGNWHDFNSYISQYTNAQLSHGVCPDCLKSFYPKYYKR